MTKREREITERHACTLEDMRDANWGHLVSPNGGGSFDKHNALTHAIKALRDQLADASMVERGAKAPAA